MTAAPDPAAAMEKKAIEICEEFNVDRAMGDPVAAILMGMSWAARECARIADDGECIATCNSFAHDDLCPVVHTAAVIRARFPEAAP